MKPVRLDFRARPGAWPAWLVGRGGARAIATALLLLAIAAGFTTLIAWQSWEANTQLAAVQSELQAARRVQGRRSLPTANAKPPISAQQSLAWNQLARQLNTPWSALLDALEAATPEEVAVVSIEPDGRQGSIRLQVEAKSLDSLLAYAGALKSIERFDQVSLVKHETNDQDATKPIRLSLDIRLKARERVQ